MIECLHCTDWEPNIKIIDGWMSIAYVHGMNNKEIKTFEYCPYCSAKLHETENDDD